MPARKTVNLRFALIFGGCLALAGIAVHYTHRYQVRRASHDLLAEATRLEAAGETADAVEYLERYLLFVPDDAGARVRHALLVNALAKTPRQKQNAYLVLSDALRRDPSRTDIRRALVPLAVGLKEYREARAELAELRAAGVEDADLMRFQARIEEAERKFTEAEEWYRKATRAAPADPDASLELATLLRGALNFPADADAEIERLLQSGGDSPRARLAAARYYRRWGDLANARLAITGPAGEACSDDADVLLLAAEVAQAEGKREDARRHLTRGAGRFPKDARFPCALAALELHGGHPDQALATALPLIADPSLPPEHLWQLGNVLIDLGETNRLEELLARLARIAPPWTTDFLRGRLQMRQEKWAEARRLFGRAAADVKVPPPPELARQAHLSIARCYARLGNPDGQMAACRMALAVDSGWLPAREELAAALVAVGQPDEALREYRTAASQSPAARLEVARLTVARALRLPPAERRWEEVEESLKNVPDALRADGQLLRAEVLLAQDKPGDARRTAEAERDREPKAVGPWLMLVAIAERDAGPKAAALVDEAERKTGPRAEWVIVRARQGLKAGGPELPARLAGLEARAGALTAAERARALLELGEVLLRTGDVAGAERVWGRVAEARPNDPELPFRLFGTAVQRGDETRARAQLQTLTGIEGAGGPLGAFAEATLHAAHAKRGDRAALPAARQALARASAARPTWPAVELLDAELSELAGDTKQATEKYEKVVAAGRAPLETVRHLVQLLAEQGRHAEARSVIARLPEQTAVAGGFEKASAQLALLSASGLQGREAVTARKEGLEEARKVARAGSTEYRDFLWLGEMALLAGEPAEAEAAFRRARDLKDSAPETWVALIVLLSRTDAAKAEVELQAARAALPPEQRPPVLAVCYEALGRPKDAAEQYKAVLAREPDAPAALRGLGAFQMRAGDVAGAEQTLRRLLALGPKLPPGTAVWGRGALAVTLASRGGFDRLKEAAALAEESAGRPDAAPEDRWTLALVRAAQPGRRRESIDLLEKAPASLPPDIRYLLARLYDQDGRWQLAQAELAGLLRTNERNPLYLAASARLLLRHDRGEDAGPLVDRLFKVTGETFDTVELRARWLVGKARPQEAAKLVKDFAARKGAGATLPAAQLLDGLDLVADAEQQYRTHANESKDPTAPLALAGFLARRGRLPEALGVCEQVRKTGAPEAAARAAVAALRTGKGGDAEAGRVEAWLDAAVAGKPQSMELQLSKADLKQYREQFAEAVDVYRHVLRAESRNVVALNNLAFLLAVKDGNTVEALELINAALAVTGPHSELLDTRAVVLTRAGRTDEAVADLQRSIADSPSAAKQFHLAQAHLKAGRKDAAATAYRDATERGLKPDELHPLERADLARVVKEIVR